MIVFKRIEEDPAGSEDRDFRVWSECYNPRERWTFSEGHLEDRTLFLGRGGYKIEVPLHPRVGQYWGRDFVLAHEPVEIDGPEVRRLEGIMANAHVSDPPADLGAPELTSGTGGAR